MANLDSIEAYNVDEMLESSGTYPDFLINGIHFGRGDFYSNKNTLTLLKHTTNKLNCWRIVDENLEEIENKIINNFYDSETYIIQWNVITERFHFNTQDSLSKNESRIYFYWKGETASKGYSPLPEYIEKDNPPVERITQWAEPPAFLQLFTGTFIVHNGKYGKQSDEPHLYILRGEVEKEIHLYEVLSKRTSLRSRTSFVLFLPKEQSSIIWHGSKTNSHCKQNVRKITESVFGSNFTEVNEGTEDEKFLQYLSNDGNYYINLPRKIIDYTPRLFYFNNITGDFLASEIECCHKSSYITPFPFLQTHLYSAVQPATFFLDDGDETWIWQGWHKNEDANFKSQCLATAINYAKLKCKTIKKYIKVQKVIAGFEPVEFTNLFPVWSKRGDIVELQIKEGVSPDKNSLIEVIAYDDEQSD